MTSDERIEIAERLRKTHGIMAFVDALGIDVDSDWYWTDVSKRVAELIDPTCHVVTSGEWTRRDVRRLRRCARRLGAMFSEAFALPPTRDTLELMRAIESAIVAANAILEKLDGGNENGE